ncbi:hypothetical protein [Phaeobacter sp. BS23]
MLIGDLVDTALNLLTFGFLGAMVWIYLRAPAKRDGEKDNPPRD